MHGPRIRRPAVLVGVGLVLALGACQQIQYVSDEGDDEWMPPNDPWWETEGDPTTTTTTSTTTGNDPSTSSSSGPDKLDLPDPDAPVVPCSTVDLLFVIDNSNSMLAEQANLIASFDSFIAGIQDNLDEANDYHIGIVTTDAYALNDPECSELGGLVTQSAAGVCGPFAEGRYISLADDLESAFTCAATIGGDGNTDEQQIEAALRATRPELNQPEACNEGFIRNDALLVIVLITDEEDGKQANEGSPGEPHTWFAELAERKGVESNVVVLALAGVPPPNACTNSEPFEGAQLGWRIADFVERFTYGQMGDVCADDYGPFFDASLAVIADACTNFTPEG